MASSSSSNTVKDQKVKQQPQSFTTDSDDNQDIKMEDQRVNQQPHTFSHQELKKEDQKVKQQPESFSSESDDNQDVKNEGNDLDKDEALSVEDANQAPAVEIVTSELNNLNTATNRSAVIASGQFQAFDETESDYVFVTEGEDDGSLPHNKRNRHLFAQFFEKVKEFAPIARMTGQRLKVELFNTRYKSIVGVSAEVHVWSPLLEELWSHFPENEDEEEMVAKVSTKKWLSLFERFSSFLDKVEPEVKKSDDVECVQKLLEEIAQQRAEMDRIAKEFNLQPVFKDSSPKLFGPIIFKDDYFGSQ